MSANLNQSFNDGEIVIQRDVAPRRLMRLPEVMNRVGLKRSTIYKRMSEGTFPKSRSLGPKCSVWVEDEVEAWIAAVVRINAALPPCTSTHDTQERRARLR